MYKILSFVLAAFMCVSLAEAKTLTMISWNATTQPGINARIVAKYMQKYIPEISEVAIKAVPGAGGIAAANYLYNVAEKDGWTIGIVPRSTPIRSFLGEPNANFDSVKFTWLGSTSDGKSDVNILISNQRYRDGLIIGDNNSGDSSLVDFVNRTTNLKFNKVAGYKDQPEIRISYERKEIDAFFAAYSGYKQNRIKGDIVLQYGSGFVRNKELSNVPTLMELAKNNDSRYLISVLELSNVVSRPFLAPPMIPENQAKKLRDAFAKIVIDEEYIKEAEKIAIDVSPIDWKQTQSIIEQLSAVDKNILKQILN